MRLARGIVCLLLAMGFGASAQFTTFTKNARHTKARLVLSHEVAKPGETVTAAIELTMDEGWHTYWENGGDSGIATSIHWSLPATLSASAIRWPVPEKFIDKEVDSTTFVFHGRAVLLVPVAIASNAPLGAIEIDALVKWLECQTACVPGSNLVHATLTVGNESKPGAEAALIVEAQRKLPSAQLPGRAVARWDGPASAAKRALVIEWSTDAVAPDFFPLTQSNFTVSAKTEIVSATPGKLLLRKFAEKQDGDWPGEVRGLLVRKESDALAGYEVALPLAPGAVAGTPAAGAQGSLATFLLYAFIGGLILNIMPCVLPVIALKILGFVQQSREHPRRVRTLGLLYALGVVVSFVVLAGFVIGIKATGQKAGWGMQFSNPQFIIVLTTIVTLVALNLFGVFELTLGGSAMNVAGQAASRHGSAGAFMNGVLATTLATPCTAPFLGPALGFAFAQPAHMIVLFFVTIALGLAFPYIVLSWNPKLLKFLPKPGVWMERFKNAMGFPMLATAMWLFTLTITHYGKRVVWLGVFLVVIAFAAWVFGEFVQRGRKRRSLAVIVVLLLLGISVGFALESKLRWRQPSTDAGNGSENLQESPDGIAWQKWSAKAVTEHLSEKRPVLVDFTAEWCLTCNTVVKPALESQAVRNKVKEVNAAALLADYTKFPPDIGAELERFGRAGVPLVIVYPKDSTKPPIVLPEAITPGMVVKALEAASK